MKNVLNFDESSLKSEEITFERDDYLKSIEGGFSQKNLIAFLTFHSESGKKFRIGINDVQNCELFNLAVEKEAIPVCLFGKYIKDDESGSALSSIGYVVMEDEISEQIKHEYPVQGGKLKRIN